MRCLLEDCSCFMCFLTGLNIRLWENGRTDRQTDNEPYGFPTWIIKIKYRPSSETRNSYATIQYRIVVGWLVGWLVYSCCTHLEHRASVKRFVSLQFLNVRHSVGLLGRVISPAQSRYLTQAQNKPTQTSMPRVGFEPTIPAFERAKVVHALDPATTVIRIV
jgi:hypothetical protein